MNKLYFTKYFPVEGEVKEDDMALNPSNGKIVRVNKACLKNLVTPEWKKVKLFICSRDIQVGDKVNTILNNLVCNGIVKEDIGNQWLFESSFTGVKIEKIKCFKVIGEISPNAVWVKEGDEFDDEDVEWNDTLKYHVLKNRAIH